MKIFLYIRMGIVIIGCLGFGAIAHGQLDAPCSTDAQCIDPPGLVCAPDPANPAEGRCQERDALLPEQQTSACYISNTKTCSQSSNDIGTCPAGKKFATLAQCEQYKQDQNRQQNNTTGARGNCATGQDCVSLVNPLGSTDIKILMGNTVKVVVGIIGTIAFVVFVYGGFQWLTSAGNSEKISKGLQAMLWAGIGIIVVFSSYAILTLIIDTLQSAP